MEYGIEILLIEDDPSAEALALLAFKRQGVTRVHAVRDGAEALEFLFYTGAYADRMRENPKLVMLDLKLPLVDGLEVLRQIRSDARTNSIPVVILTASEDEDDMDQAYSLLANSYIVKPMDFDEFSVTMKHVTYYWLNLNRQPSGGRETPWETLKMAGARG